MKRAVRELIKARQPHAKYVVEEVAVEHVGGRKHNDCFTNCADFVEEHTSTRRYKVVSGWLVDEYDADTDATAITQHYWLYDTKHNRHIDVTNFDGDIADMSYVTDVDLMLYSQTNFDEVSNCVGHSLWYENRQWFLVYGDRHKGLHKSKKPFSKLPTPLFYSDAVFVDKAVS